MDYADELYKVLDQAYDALNEAYWAASTIQDKDRLKGVLDVLDDLLTSLNQQSFASRTALMDALGQQVKDVNTRLERVKKEIDQIVHSVDTATKVAKAADKAITAIAKFVV